jgi:transposase
MVISNEKRADIIKHLQAGKTKEDIAKWFFVSVRSIRRLWHKFLSSGDYKPEPLNNGRKPKVSDETMKRIVLRINELPDITLEELIEEFDLTISKSALCGRLIKLGLTFKKRHSIQMNKNVTML